MLQHLRLTPCSQHQLQWDSCLGLLESSSKSSYKSSWPWKVWGYLFEKQTYPRKAIKCGTTYSRRFKIMEFYLQSWPYLIKWVSWALITRHAQLVVDFSYLLGHNKDIYGLVNMPCQQVMSTCQQVRAMKICLPSLLTRFSVRQSIGLNNQHPFSLFYSN